MVVGGALHVMLPQEQPHATPPVAVHLARLRRRLNQVPEPTTAAAAAAARTPRQLGPAPGRQEHLRHTHNQGKGAKTQEQS